jgi:hypothetical protein
MSAALVGVVSVLIGFFVVQFEFLVAWIAKDTAVAGPLLDALAWMFPLSGLLVWLVGLVALPPAIILARRSGRPRMAFVAVAGTAPVVFLALYWAAVLVLPDLSSAYRAFVPGRPLAYYTLIMADAVVLSVGTTAMALVYLGLVQLGRRCFRSAGQW